MTEELGAWIVGLQWTDGKLTINALVAPSAAFAAALSATDTARHPDAPSGELGGVIVVPLDLEWLHYAVRSIEGGKPAGEVVSLVRNPSPSEGADVAETGPLWSCGHRHATRGEAAACKTASNDEPPGAA